MSAGWWPVRSIAGCSHPSRGATSADRFRICITPLLVVLPVPCFTDRDLDEVPYALPKALIEIGIVVRECLPQRLGRSFTIRSSASVVVGGSKKTPERVPGVFLSSDDWIRS
jgi:hypothetical protein